MSVTVHCSGCEHEFEVETSKAGRTVHCPACDAATKAPRSSDVSTGHRRPAVAAADSGISVTMALLIGGAVLLVGVLVMLALRFSQLDRTNDDSEITELVEPTGGADPQDRPGIDIPSPAPADSEHNVIASPGEESEAAAASTGEEASGEELIDVTDSDHARRLMAAMTSVAIRIDEFPEDVRGAIRRAIEIGVKAELDRCQVSYRAGDADPLMVITLDVRKQAGTQKLWMSAVLRAGDGGKAYKVWGRSGSVVTISAQSLKSGILPPNLDRDISTFFTSLRGDFVDARRN